ncbi:hypothetical protein DESUT3_29700 [Desulfuromonas versatilis]|uniref:Tetratricopeptide repeat protein n=1 Tax=Desulfuromonas versatilis TaxID=2802975 RepID=A0ABN6E0T1_9BACT|nr:tetratricopeptide repeat protein [Desulfuromonas versatilis]BCR05901.1 hypothetical protein DESUT3_29700 [Desulfuromonas versatilis]
MIRVFRRAAPFAALLLLTGCVAMQLAPPEPPVSSPVTPPTGRSLPEAPPSRPAPAPQEPETAPYQRPVYQPPPVETPVYEAPSYQPPPEPASRNTAVVALLQKSQGQASAGQWDAAGASLERALRIEPRNPALWQELARVRLGQGDYRQAENLAAKSNALAGGDRRLRAENWRIIGEARKQRGDAAGAKEAFARAERERGW